MTRMEKLINVITAGLLSAVIAYVGKSALNIILILFPFPILLTERSEGIWGSLVSSVISFFVMKFFMEDREILALFIFSLPLVLSFHIAMKGDMAYQDTIFFTSLISLLVYGLAIIIYNGMTGNNFIDELYLKLNEEIGKGLDRLSMIDDSLLEGEAGNPEYYSQSFIKMLPGLVFISLTVVHWINISLTLLTAKSLGVSDKEIPPLKDFSLKRPYYIACLILFISCIVLQVSGSPNWDSLLISLVLIFIHLLFIQGMALFDYWLKSHDMSTLSRVLIPIFIIFFLGLGIIYPIIALVNLFKAGNKNEGR